MKRLIFLLTYIPIPLFGMLHAQFRMSHVPRLPTTTGMPSLSLAEAIAHLDDELLRQLEPQPVCFASRVLPKGMINMSIFYKPFVGVLPVYDAIISKRLYQEDGFDWRLLPEPTTVEMLKEHARFDSLNSGPKTLAEFDFRDFPENVEMGIEDSVHKLAEFYDDPSLESPCVVQSLNDIFLVQRYMEKHGYFTFYHGASAQYALFLKINKMLRARYDEKRSVSELWQYLRAPGVGKRYEHVNLSSERHLCDNEAFLPVAYSPLRETPGFRLSEGPMQYWVNNVSEASFANKKFFQDQIMRLFGQSWWRFILRQPRRPSFEKVDAAVSRLSEFKRGICVQVFIHHSLVDDVAYHSGKMGLRPNNDDQGSHQIKVNDNKWIWVFDPFSHVKASVFNRQARIILKPSVFGKQNEKVKIIVWDFFTSEQKEFVEGAAQELVEEYK